MYLQQNEDFDIMQIFRFLDIKTQFINHRAKLAHDTFSSLNNNKTASSTQKLYIWHCTGVNEDIHININKIQSFMLKFIYNHF